MKRILITLLVVAVSATALFAQEAKHAKFMGVDMGISIASFEKQLLQKGFAKHRIYEIYDVAILGELAKSQVPTDTRWYEGKFAGQDVELIVIHTRSGLVYEVRVLYPDTEEWSEVNSDYQEMKELFVKKYGAPYKCVETVKADPMASEFCQLQEGAAQCYSAFSIPNGKAGVYIISQDNYHASLFVIYYDDKAQQAFEEEKLGDI